MRVHSEKVEIVDPHHLRGKGGAGQRSPLSQNELSSQVGSCRCGVSWVNEKGGMGEIGGPGPPPSVLLRSSQPIHLMEICPAPLRLRSPATQRVSEEAFPPPSC